MSFTKIAGIVAALFCIAIFATNFYQMHFGPYVATANIPAMDILAIKWVSALLTLMSIWALATIVRAPALGRQR